MTKRNDRSKPGKALRRAFTLRLKPNAFKKYKYYHDNIWPELVAEIDRCGIAQITTFRNGNQLFLYSEIYDKKAWDNLWNSKVHDEWAVCMRPLMQFRSDGKVDAGPLREIFHLTPEGVPPVGKGKARTPSKSRGRLRAEAR